jgi:hypothetical protein
MTPESTQKTVESQSSLTPDFLVRALQACTDGLFLFDCDKRLIFANQRAESLQANVSRLRIGSRCCEMFWNSEGGDNCVVDRALQNGLKLEFEIPGVKPLRRCE